ncbi:unnamed protein product [Oppiella nova]|uniref:MABP1/WDR62 second WD40 domain-containing protein n=1 Tax=Oppiella nova TaxID=334625 RepID=A0A7R9M483_9ACAR|nr:unnamed protein product [Oppiella nova]CAG2170479.1 unnamed protein product [Oppiella nova]
MGRSAILGDQRNNYFCDVSCGRPNMADSTYAITKSGLLCEFNSRRLLDKWVELRTTSANCISISDELICVGCAQGIVRCFNPKNLHFVCTLPRPHSLGIDIARGFTRNDLSAGSAATSNVKYPDTIALSLDATNEVVTCVYGDRSIYFWTISNMKKIGKLHSFLYHSSCIWAVETYPNLPNSAKQLLPSGTFLTCSSDDTIRIWNLDVLKGSQESNYVYKRNIFSAELLKILYMDPELSYICDVDVNPNENNDKPETTYDGKNGVRSLRLSPDGRHLASGDRSGNIRIFDLELQQDLCKIEAHDSEVLCLEYSDEHHFDGKSLLASASRDRLIHIFDVKQQYSFVQTMDDHSSSITAVKFVRNNDHKSLQMISCGADKSIIFRKGTEANVDVEQNYALTACQDRMIRVYDVKSGKNTTNFKGSQGDDGTLIKIALDPSGQFIATSCTDKSLYIYDYQTGECLAATSGHSELVTGLKFSQNGKNLISVSGDGCVFIWKLPNEMVNSIASKLGLPVVPLVESPKIEIPTKPPLITNDNNEENSLNGNNSALYRFNLKSLPLWAKKQMVEELSRDPNAKGELEPSAKPAVPAKGRWAQRMENSQNLVVKSYLPEDTVIPYPTAKTQNTNGFANDKDLNSRIQTDKNGDFRYRMTDSSSASSFTREDDEDINTTDSDNTGYSNDKLSGSVFKVNESPDNHKNRKSKNALKRYSGIGVVPSISVPNFNELHSDEDDDSNTTAGESDRSANTKNPIYMSTENLDRIDQREKYLKSAFENLDKLNDSQLSDKNTNRSDSLTPNRSSISSKYHSKTSPISPISNTTNDERVGKQMNSRTPLTSKPPISKRREELTKAISEARKKLQTLGWKGSGLSNSKSVANLRDYNFESDSKDVNGNDASEAIRRSISLSDLSFGPQKKLLSKSTLNLNSTGNSSAPLWDKNRNSDGMSRSTSISTLSKVDSIKSVSLKSKGLWSNSTSQTSLRPNVIYESNGSTHKRAVPSDAYTDQKPKALEETPVKLRSNSSSSGSGLWATPPLPLIQNEGLDLSMTNPSTIPLTQELCQLVVNELNSISRYAVRILERSAETGNANMRQFLSENISKTCHSLQSSVTPTPALQGMHRNSDALVVPNQSNIPYNDSNYSLPPESMTQAMTLLQQYSDKLLNLVEQRITKKE